MQSLRQREKRRLRDDHAPGNVEVEPLLEWDQRVEQFGDTAAVRRRVQLQDTGTSEVTSERPHTFELIGGCEFPVWVDALGCRIDETDH